MEAIARHFSSIPSLILAAAIAALLSPSDASATTKTFSECGGVELSCGDRCELLAGPTCESACAAQAAEAYCLDWCGLTHCHEYDCYEWRCMAYCEPEFWYGCPNECGQGGALFCTGGVTGVPLEYLPFISSSNQSVCVDSLCSMGFVEGSACL